MAAEDHTTITACLTNDKGDKATISFSNADSLVGYSEFSKTRHYFIQVHQPNIRGFAQDSCLSKLILPMGNIDAPTS